MDLLVVGPLPRMRAQVRRFFVDLASEQVRLSDGEVHGFRTPDYPEAMLLTDARDYNPICAARIEKLDTRLREYGCKASGTELLQHIRLHSLVGSDCTDSDALGGLCNDGGARRPTDTGAGWLDLGGAQSIRETDHAEVVTEAG